MNGFELNKIAASIIVAGLIAMLSGYGAKMFFYEGHHKEVKRGYQVEVTEDSGAADSGTKGPKIPAFEIGKLMAAANAENGKNIFKKCATCHDPNKGGPNKVGPGIWNVINHPKAAHDGYSYSEALKAMSDQKWGYEELFKFIYSPKDYAKGTKMGFAGLKKPEEIADLVSYLRTLSDSQAALPAADLITKAVE
ncbi:MAG: cytochrome c family protein [Alphaproteobacteria bacterium]|nr:cytochrome c family protein [Alphaproteobacteria bacterium]OJV14228.1 MAG: hypothetical protein BGO27_01865 [Alphaproteobacteria bacterium 33-17]